MQQTATPFIVNALFSLASGSAMIVAANWMTETLIRTDPLFFTVVGGVLLGFSALIFGAAAKGVPLGLGLFISLQDALWVILTSLGLLLFADYFTGVGVGALLAVNTAVLGFTLAQMDWLRERFAHPDATSGFESRLVTEAAVSSSRDRIWARLAMLDDIVRYAPGLVSSTMVEGDSGMGAVRECRASGGEVWRERITAWDDGHSFELVFNTDSPDFPFPVRAMAGGWAIRDEAGETRVEAHISLTPKSAITRFLLPVLAFVNNRKFLKVIDNLDHA